MKKNIWVILLAVVIIGTMIISMTDIINTYLGMSIAFVLFTVFSFNIAGTAKKSDVKIIEYTMTVFGILSIVLVILNIVAYFKNTNAVTDDYAFRVLVTKEQSEKKLIFTYDNHNYYTYNLSNVEIISNGNKTTLKEAIENKVLTLDDILNLTVPNPTTATYTIYYDGGENNYQNDEYSIVVCKNETNDVVFAPFDYKYEESICK